jgi:hypothetical protein
VGICRGSPPQLAEMTRSSASLSVSISVKDGRSMSLAKIDQLPEKKALIKARTVVRMCSGRVAQAMEIS